MKSRRVVLWRVVAAVLWVISNDCLFKAIGDGVHAEESLNNPYFSAADRGVIAHMAKVADMWSGAGWALQAAVAIVLTGGMKAEKMVRRVFQSLGVLIAADGVLLLASVTLISRF